MKYENVGIIGAGIAGLVCADRLRREGISVTILDKSRGVGGRSATRHLEVFDDQLQISCAGDWCGGVTVEAAFLSGYALTELLLETR